MKDAADVRIFPPAVPVLVILVGSLLDRPWPMSLGLDGWTPWRYWLGGGIVVGAILGLGLWPVLLFRLRGQSENPWKPTLFIEDRGPFRITRNPMYLQMILVCIGFSVSLSNAWTLALTPIGALALQKLAIEPEEIYLESKFGEKYLSYKARVRRWI